MKFRPVISIALGVVTAILFSYSVMFLFTIYAFNSSSESAGFIPFLIFGFLIGGYIATNFAKDRKIRYSLYEGLILGVLIVILELFNQIYDIGFLIYL